ncbi:non-specific serine/threonine protein kinase [Mycobacterium senriense]|uniref:non-specific serine/threonine protein kinase n=1 Tax=Mycobacterium senriense TaxID=2775496 RepID=A0ABN6ICH9_9MYCO|nr:serine/threonine-protein kinase PknD [Mycobacterium senriense]BCZ20583.1 serine/threonine-protein kinase PknD [Mycobacterium senriense]
MRQSEPDTRVGSQFGPYRLLRLLGRGGMGEVYEAEDTRKHRVVALKLISPQFSGDPMFRARMQREADAAGRLTEPHVVPIHDYGEIDGLLYLDMRLIDGIDLSTLLKRFGALSPPRAVAIVRQVAAALDAAHSSGVTHRDVKPENILITRDDFAYLVDFGIARAAADPQLTQTGVAMGSYHYMAPERFTDHEVTYRADIYSLTCVLLECLTGSPPYRTTSIERAVAAHLTEPAPRPSQLRPGSIPAALDEVIARGMAKSPEERYRSAGELAAAANDALTGAQQLQANTILRDGESAIMHPNANDHRSVRASDPSVPSPAADTVAGPLPAGVTGASSGRSGPGPSMIRAAPTGSGHAQGPGPDFRRPVVPNDGKRRQWIIVGAVALVALVAFVVAVIGYLSTQPSTPASGQTVLPFNGIDFRLSPGGVALNKAGDVFVTNQGMYGRVVELASGSSTATVLPFTGLYQPQGLAVDSAGAVYVADFNNRVVKLAAGSNSQTVLPFSGLNYPEGVAVDTQNSVYVADRGNSRVVKLASGSSTQDVLPFTGLKNPDGVAVDTAGNVYVTDTDNNRVLELAAGATAQTVLPFTGVSVPWGIAVDGAGNVYVTEHDSNKVMKLAAGSNTPSELNFTGLNTPLDVTVDNAGNVYVADRGNDRVVKLRP